MERWTTCVLPGLGGSRRRGQVATGLLMNIARRRYGDWKRSSGNFRSSSFACEWRRTRRSLISSWRSVARVPSRRYNPRTRIQRRGPALSDTMTTTYGLDFDDLARPRSRGTRIARIDALATLLDTALVIPGTGVRFGLDALIGLFPVVGDIITTALSLFIVHEAYQLGAPGHVIVRMLGNVALDGVFGAVPLVGDAFDVLWRANRRNVRLLQEWLQHEHRRERRRRPPGRGRPRLPPSQSSRDRFRRFVEGVRLGDRRPHHGDHHCRLALGKSRVQHRQLRESLVC